MKATLRFLSCLAFVFGVVCSAQSTTYSVPATSCQAFSTTTHNCEFPVATPSGEAIVSYAPLYQGRNNVIEFYDALSSLGLALVDSVTTSTPMLVSTTGKNNTQGYSAVYLYSEQTTFHGSNYAGSTSLIYTVSTRCCSSGRGPHQASTWATNSGAVTITQ